MRKVYLATYPRSGNGYLRILLEHLTGQTTSSIYVDAFHEAARQPWGGWIQGNSPGKYGFDYKRTYPKDYVVIKTHWPVFPPSISDEDLSSPNKVVRIVRNPIDCFFSYQMFQGSKAGAFNMSKVKGFIKEYRKFQQHWNNHKGEILTIKYENLLLKPEQTLKKIIDFIDVETIISIQESLKLAPPSGYIYKHKNHFTPEQLRCIREELKDLMTSFDYSWTDDPNDIPVPDEPMPELIRYGAKDPDRPDHKAKTRLMKPKQKHEMKQEMKQEMKHEQKHEQKHETKQNNNIESKPDQNIPKAARPVINRSLHVDFMEKMRIHQEVLRSEYLKKRRLQNQKKKEVVSSDDEQKDSSQKNDEPITIEQDQSTSVEPEATDHHPDHQEACPDIEEEQRTTIQPEITILLEDLHVSD